MTDDKLMREEFIEQTVAIATVPRELKWFIWQIAVRACAAECARMCEQFAADLQLGTSASCFVVAKQIRERFGVEG
ncbi:MAG: hypothetical protein HMLKMBBP_01531 [Planctomycetes bacterium]|nr:hypothetical protein [Planctomycetota bacterium]